MRTKKRDRLDRALKALKKIDDKVLGSYPATPFEKVEYKRSELRMMREHYQKPIPTRPTYSAPPATGFDPTSVLRVVPGLMGMSDEEYRREREKARREFYRAIRERERNVYPDEVIWDEPAEVYGLPLPTWELIPYTITEMP